MIILAVDDEKAALEALTGEIKIAEPGAEVYGFRKAVDALSFLDNVSCSVVFLDISMRGTSGIELARQMKLKKPDINIIFATGYSEYTGEAIQLRCSGYLMKPVTAEMIREELDNLRYPIRREGKKRVRFCTFGNFEVYVDDKPVNFRYKKTKEMLAYLVDRCGALCSNGEIMAALWPDDTHASYLRSMKKDLADTMKELNCQEILLQQWGKIGIVTECVDCDFYAWREGDVQAINSYRGEYMSQYGWSEFTNGYLNKKRKNVKTDLSEEIPD